ncbi:MAG TPA: Gfo/Idh/MocA family oxidoreductase [Candidatus Limnocylindrales bacterium]|nr:Gfo/Idh/MocA family oxidoreductase [Candidatus Limnocylindrales bacterium]
MKDQFVIAQIGCGYWGPNLLRNFSALKRCRVKNVVDASYERRAFVEANFPRTIAVANHEVVLADPEIDAVVIATPAATHFKFARAALQAGKNVFVEKPMATTAAEVDELARVAGEKELIVMVGHTFIYNAAVRYVKDLIDAGALGEIRYIYSQRLNLGRIRSDIDALWNFAPHDISIIQYWLGDPTPLSVSRRGMAYMQDGIDDVVFLSLTYPKKIMANIHVSWLDPQKVRKMIVVGSKKMVVYDDVADDKVAIYDKGIDRRAVLGENMDFDNPRPQEFNYRSGDILLPQVKFVEPLRVEAEHFLDCIKNKTTPLTGLAHAREVVSILEQAGRNGAR